LRKAVVLLAIGFTVTLAAIVGTRLSAESLAVIIGVVCGVSAGIPVSLMILTASNRRERLVEEPRYGQPENSRYGSFPPVVVIQGGGPANAPTLPAFYPSQQPVYDSTPRQFHLVGEQED
jgi:hypothetical protein